MMKSNQFRPTLNALENRSLMSASPWAIEASMPEAQALVPGQYREYLGREARLSDSESAINGHVKAFKGNTGHIDFLQSDSESAASGHVKVFDGAGGPPIRSFAPETAYLMIVLKDALISSAHGDPAAFKVELTDVLISSVHASAGSGGMSAGKPSFSDLSAVPTDGTEKKDKKVFKDVTIESVQLSTIDSRPGSGVLKIG